MASAPETKTSEADSPGTVSNILNEIIYSPVNLLLTVIIVVLVYKILKSKFAKVAVEAPTPELPKLRKDMTVTELRQFDGNQPDGRVLVAVNGWIFDVTRGRRFYGPGECILVHLYLKIAPTHCDSLTIHSVYVCAVHLSRLVTFTAVPHPNSLNKH